jgi:uncharacterized protein
MSSFLPGAAPVEPAKVRKIWVAMSTPFQANFFAPLIKELSSEFDFVVTARDHDRIQAILDAKRIEYIPVGKHGGRELSNKLEAYADTIQKLIPIVKREKPDILLTERWPEAVRTAFGFNIPSWTIFYDERERHVNEMVFPLATKIFTPRFYTFQDLYQNGVIDPDKVVWFNGFHTGYLKGADLADENPYRELGLDAPVVFVRPEPEFASFFPSHQQILERAVTLIQKGGKASLAVLPRTEAQEKKYARMGVTSIDESMIESPVAHSDVAIGAAETMLMEAFVLGKPAVSAIYWEPSKPVTELHKYIPHSTDPVELARYVEDFLDQGQVSAYKEKATLLVQNMDNPVQLMIDEIRRLNLKKEEVVLKRRSKMEIYIAIIQAASLQPLRPTHMMKAANISYNELRSIVEALESKGLISEENTIGGKYYQTTKEGLRVLQDYKIVHSRLFAN